MLYIEQICTALIISLYFTDISLILDLYFVICVLTKCCISGDLPAFISNLNIDAYDINKAPSCFEGHANMVLPGYLLLSNGSLYVAQDYDLISDGLVKATVTSDDGDVYCRDGKSMRCTINLCEFIGNDICEVLQRQGTHTIEELVEKVHFDPWIKLPNPPCFMGLICLTDLFEVLIFFLIVEIFIMIFMFLLMLYYSLAIDNAERKY
uniref:Methuselah_N domain-containing protein n=1 Tax=Syphacia muris TaxID=451379 RepID=A0A0N5B1F6_9BILA